MNKPFIFIVLEIALVLALFTMYRRRKVRDEMKGLDDSFRKNESL